MNGLQGCIITLWLQSYHSNVTQIHKWHINITNYHSNALVTKKKLNETMHLKTILEKYITTYSNILQK